MTRMPSLFTRLLPVAVIGLMATVPALAQTTPPPSRATTMPAPPTAAPTAVPPGFALPGPRPQPGQSPQASQATTPPAAAPRAEAPRAPYLGGPNNQAMPAHTNIRLDLTITDTFTGSPVKKNVSLMVLTNNGGMIRTTGADGWSNLNIDAVVAAYTNGLVSVRMTFEYTPPISKEPTSGGNRPPRLNESITVVLQDSKPMIVSQSADPATDRKVTAELTATILK